MGDIMTYAWKSVEEMVQEIEKIIKSEMKWSKFADEQKGIKSLSKDRLERYLAKAYYEILGTGISLQQLTVSDKQRHMFFEAERRIRQKYFGGNVNCYMRESTINKFNLAPLYGLRQP